jgi:hypothetical protein
MCFLSAVSQTRLALQQNLWRAQQLTRKGRL